MVVREPQRKKCKRVGNLASVVQGLEFKGFGFRVCGSLGWRAQCVGFSVLGFRVLGFPEILWI